MIGVIGKKKGMTRIFTKDGTSIPITVIEIKTNKVVQIKNFKEKDYISVQLTTGKKMTKIKKSEIGHFSKAGVEIGLGLWEFRILKDKNLKFTLGQKIDINIFSNIKNVDITGTSKGKGFSGTVKRWNFHMQDATHGNSLSHRVPGSIGQNQTPGRVFKGKKMAGQLGNKKRTVQNLKIISIDFEKKLLFVKGSVPGSVNSNLIIKESIKI